MKEVNFDQESQLLHLGRIDLGDHHLHPGQRFLPIDVRDLVDFDPAKMNGPEVGVLPKIDGMVHI
jgi:hypothetical protein